MLGVGVACALWWVYFDVVAVVAEHRFVEPRGHEQLRIARDSYCYLHLPMIAGIVLVALGLKKTLEHVDDPLKMVPAVALFGGVALYCSPTSPSGCGSSAPSTSSGWSPPWWRSR